MMGVVDCIKSSEIKGLRFWAAKNGGRPSTNPTLPVPALAFAARPMAYRNVSCVNTRFLFSW
jgi:hypothetical protein